MVDNISSSTIKNSVTYSPASPIAVKTAPIPKDVQQQSVKEEVQIKPKISQRDLQQALDEIRPKLSEKGLGLRYNKKIGQFIVTITEKSTGKIIAEIPGENVVRFKESMADMSGMILNKRA